jgi:hypothetical protein
LVIQVGEEVVMGVEMRVVVEGVEEEAEAVQGHLQEDFVGK